MSWVWIVLGVFAGCFVGYFFGKRKFKPRTARTRTDKKKLEGLERKVYDILVKGDGDGYFSKVAEEYGIGRGELGDVVKSLVGKGLVKDRVFSYRRKLELIDYLNKRERKVLEFVGRKGEADVSLIMKRCKVDDHVLIPMGKKFVRMGLVVKVRRGYKTFFVMSEKG